jgi:hypothetical protein
VINLLHYRLDSSTSSKLFFLEPHYIGVVCLVTTKNISNTPCVNNVIEPRWDIRWDKNIHNHPTQVSFLANRAREQALMRFVGHI